MRHFFVLIMLMVASWSGIALSQERQRCAICAVTEGSGAEPVAATIEHEGKTYYFCSEGCKEKFALLKRSDWQNKVIVVDFWATCVDRACPKSRNLLNQRQHEKDLRVLAFSYDKEVEDQANHVF